MKTDEVGRPRPVGTRTPTVLVVEDDPAQQILIREALAPAGLVIDTVATMFDALELMALQPGAVDVVVVDLGLPDIGGLESLEIMLRAVEVPVVVHSGNATSGLPEACRRAGAVAFVHKDEGVGRLADVVTANISAALSLPRVPDEVVRRLGVEPQAPSDFASAVRATLDFLHEQLPLGAWMVTRVEGDDWIVLDALDDTYGVKAGEVLRWSDSFCSRMVQGQGPSFTGLASDVEAYAAAPIGQTLPIETYVGLPLVVEGTGLFGTICGIDPSPMDRQIHELEAVFTHAARMLSTSLSIDLERDRLQRRLDLAKAASRTDPLTGLPNRRAFDLMLRVEENRCRRYGTPAAVAIVDLDGLKRRNDTLGHEAGDDYLRMAAVALSSVLRASDMAFRVGGDEFAIIAAPCTAAESDALGARLRDALRDADVAASLGVASRMSHLTLVEVVDLADSLMYEEKRQKG